MTRKEIYAVIKEYALQDVIKRVFGVNYTNISTAELEKFLNQSAPKKKTSKNVAKPEDDCPALTELYKVVDRLLQILVDKHILLKSEWRYITEGGHKI